MLFLRSWLEDYINLSTVSNTELTKKITAFSMEVEEVREMSDYFDGLVVVGQINDPKSVEGSDKLRVFKVDLGDRHVQIVSAAPNVVDKMYVAVALSGAKLPRGYNIAERKMMGYVTQGMCLGKSELCLEEGYSSGLWEIENELKVKSEKLNMGEYLGKPISALLPEYFPTETIFDIKVLPNSMGILSNHLGLAYEIALIYNDFNLLKPKAKDFLNFETVAKMAQETIKSSTQTEITFKDNAKYINYYSLYSVKLPIGEFVLPATIAKRMFLIAQNTVSSIVDISNYLIYDIGQPTHFFSKTKTENLVNTDKIELSIDVLDQDTPFEGLGHLKNTVLKSGIAVIQANNIPVILPGISGGITTALDPKENEMYLEIANFKAEDVAKNSFNLGFDRSQATRVFAGGVPSIKILLAVIHLKELFGVDVSIQSLLFSGLDGQKLSPEEILNQLRVDYKAQMTIDLNYLKSRILGIEGGQDTTSENILNTLKFLGEVQVESGQKSDKVVFIPNKLYTAYEVKEDVVADLARLNDLIKIESKNLEIRVNPEIDLVYRPFVELKNAVSKLGFTETINRPFVSGDILDAIPDGKKNSILILNPIRSQEPYNRTGLIESLLQTTRRNLESGQSSVSIFELNKVYRKIEPNNDPKILKIVPTVQTRRLLGILTTELAIQDLTSIMHEILGKIKQTVGDFSSLNDELALNGYVANNDQISVKIFQINNLTKKKFDIPLSKNVNYLEFDLSNWDNLFNPYQNYREDKEFPDLKRSLSFYIPQTVTFNQVKTEIESLDLIRKSEFEVVVEGVERFVVAVENENTQKDILNINLKLNHPSRTIKGTEADEIESAILLLLQSKLDAGIVRR